MMSPVDAGQRDMSSGTRGKRETRLVDGRHCNSNRVDIQSCDSDSEPMGCSLWQVSEFSSIFSHKATVN